MKMFASQKNSQEALKDALIRAIGYYLYCCWSEKNGFSNPYTRKHKEEEWVKIYTLFSVACDTESYRKGFNSSIYVDERNLILLACEKNFLNEEMSPLQEQAFASFVEWVCKGSTIFNPVKVKEYIHLSQFKYALTEKGYWKEEYSFKAA